MELTPDEIKNLPTDEEPPISDVLPEVVEYGNL